MSDYCFDTSAFMEPWNRWYPVDVFPSLWESISEHIRHNRIISPLEVKRELQAKDDALYRWLRDHDGLFQEETLEIVEFMHHEIFAIEQFRRIAEAGRNGADPLVISLAKVTGRTVVTNEQRVGSESRRVKIPRICDHFGVRWIGPLQYYRETGIRI